jgi:rhodanese-related sulfurtransferase
MVTRLSVQQFQAMRDCGDPFVLIDVRQPGEYEVARIDGGVLIPLMDLPVRLGEIQPDDGVPVVVYCHHGVRSLKAAYFLAQSGLENVASLDGGIDAWSLQIDPGVPRY